MTVKYLTCIGICFIILFFNLYLVIICADRLDKCERQKKDNKAVFYATLSIIGFMFSVGSGIGIIILITQLVIYYLKG